MATIKPEDYNKKEYYRKNPEKMGKNLFKGKQSGRQRRTKEQVVADNEFIWELVKKGKTTRQIHKMLNKERGYNPPLKVTTINHALRYLKQYHTDNMAGELHKYQERKIITMDELMKMALTQFENSVDREDIVETFTYSFNENGEEILEKKIVVKSKKQSSVEWYKVLLQSFKLHLELTGEIKPKGATLNANVGIFNIDGDNKDFNVLHKNLQSLTDEQFTYYLQKKIQGEAIDVDEIVRTAEKNKQFIIEGEVQNVTD